MNKVTVLKVTFFKEKVNFFGEQSLKKVEFDYECDNKKSIYENECEAFDIAVEKGHNPNRNIKFNIIQSNI